MPQADASMERGSCVLAGRACGMFKISKMGHLPSPDKWLNSMVYGRYTNSIHGIYKPTYNWGAPSCKYEM